MATKNITDIQVLKAYQDSKVTIDGKWPYDLLMELTGQCEKVCYRAMERACKRGLIDYGTSLRSGWITNKGYELLNKTSPDSLQGFSGRPGPVGEPPLPG